MVDVLNGSERDAARGCLWCSQRKREGIFVEALLQQSLAREKKKEIRENKGCRRATVAKLAWNLLQTLSIFKKIEDEIKSFKNLGIKLNFLK